MIIGLIILDSWILSYLSSRKIILYSKRISLERELMFISLIGVANARHNQTYARTMWRATWFYIQFIRLHIAIRSVVFYTSQETRVVARR